MIMFLAAVPATNTTKAQAFPAETYSAELRFAKEAIENGWLIDKVGPCVFQDIGETDWFYRAVQGVVDLELFAGTDRNAFSPHESMTRGMFVTVLGKFAKVNPGDYEGPSGFTDVAASAYYAPYVNWAGEKALVSGTGNQEFSPEDPVTREQACIMLFRLATTEKLHLPNVARWYPIDYEDLADLAEISKTAIRILTEASIVSGRRMGEFAPREKILRCEGAQLFSMAYDVLYDVKERLPDSETNSEVIFTIEVPGTWHGKAGYRREIGSSEDEFSHIVPGHYDVLHVYNQYVNPDPAYPSVMSYQPGLVFSIVAVEDKLRYTGVFMHPVVDELLYDVINKVRYDGRDWLIFCREAKPNSRYTYGASEMEKFEYAKLENCKEQVLASIEYAPGVEILE